MRPTLERNDMNKNEGVYRLCKGRVTNLTGEHTDDHDKADPSASSAVGAEGDRRLVEESGALDEIFARIDAGEALDRHAGLREGHVEGVRSMRGLDAELSDHVAMPG